MSELFQNTTAYYVLAIIVYMFIALTGVLLNVPFLKIKTMDLISMTRAALRTNKTLLNGLEIFFKFVIKPLINILRIIFNALCLIAELLNKAEDHFINNISPELTEPVNYAALILRKCYTNSGTAVIKMTAALFVVFYFILSIF